MPSFFLSHSSKNSNPYLVQFFTDLSARLEELGHPEGFMEVVALETGDHWNEALQHALQTAGTFVPILAPPYFKSRNCGREWWVFDQRLQGVANAANPPLRLIFPVLWYGLDDIGPIPEVVNGIQLWEPAFGTLYRDKGLQYLIQHKYHAEREYVNVLDVLARRIHGSLPANNPPPLNVPGRWEDIPSIFDGEAGGAGVQYAAAGPDSVQLIFIADKREEWHPRFPDGQERMIGDLAKDVVSDLAKKSEILREKLDGESISRIRAACENNAIVGIVVDPQSVADDSQVESNKFLHEYDSLNLRNCGSVILWNDIDLTQKSREEFTACLAYACPNKFRQDDPDRFNEVWGEVEAFMATFKKAILRAQERIMKHAEVKKRPPGNRGGAPNIAGPTG